MRGRVDRANRVDREGRENGSEWESEVENGGRWESEMEAEGAGKMGFPQVVGSEG